MELAGCRQQVRASAALTTPDDSYHGITYAERFGKEGAFITKATAQLMRDFGSGP